MNEFLEAIEHETAPNPQYCMIVMHGLGADGNDFVPIVNELRLPRGAAVRFIFPHAPTRPVTINGGHVMRAWYDILGADLTRREDETGVRESQRQIEAMVAREKTRGIAADKIVLAGFSQGGAIALQTGLRAAEPLAGIMALSTYLPLAGRAAAERDAVNQHVPIFMAHGTQDPVIPLSRAVASRDALKEMGYQVEWHEYPMPHSVCPQEIRDMENWLLNIFAQ